ncbi:hypothetical protein ABBQ32_010286 [Trebouxia sp. C0010 RCD-2024]
MNSRLVLGLLVVAFCGSEVCLRFFGYRSQQVWSSPTPAFQQLHFRNNGIFHSIDEEHEAYRIYRQTQDNELKALKYALDPEEWGESVVVKPRVKATEGSRLIWDVFGPFYNCPSKERVGTPPVAWDGGKWVCGVQTLRHKPKCTVYSFGSNGETSFEEHLLRLTDNNCNVHVFDYSLNKKKASKVRAIKGATLHEYGIGKEDTIVKKSFKYAGHVTKEYELKSLPTIMTELGHSWVDLLKMDVEGAEYDVLPAWVTHYSALKQRIPVTQAQIEYHHSSKGPKMALLVKTFKMMEASGFRTFSTEYNINGAPWNFVEYSYLHVDNDGNVVSDTEVPD